LAKGSGKIMAKKRLNKKVALIGSVVFAFLVLAAIGVVLHLSRDPEKFIRDGDAAMKAANEAIDKEVKEEEYKKAERSYLKARSLAKTDSLRMVMLFKLVDIYIETDLWNNVLGCWSEIVRIDPKNVKARFRRLNYFYIMADSGVSRVWQEVASQASEFIEVAENAGMLAEDTAKWESFGIQQAEAGAERMGPYLYLLRGRAALEMAKMGAVTDPDESLAKAVGDLERVRELEPSNVDAYWYLAQAIIAKGEIFASRGDFEERDKAADSALELLEQAVGIAGDDPKAHINFLTMKLMLAQKGSAAQRQERIQSLESEYLSLVQEFNSNALAHSQLARFYHRLDIENLDKAIEAVERAMELDEENVAYAMDAANLHYRKFSIYGQKSQLIKAIELAKNALTLPGAQEKVGSRRWANKMNRISLYVFLANCYIEQVLEPCEPRTELQSQEWLADAEQAVREIEQLFGSGEEPQVIKWQGMLELAKGNKDIATRALYAAYEQLKASGRADAQLSYALAKIFKDTSELGAAAEFLTSALNAGVDWTKPEARLDYVEVFLKLNAWTAAISNINIFEENFGSNERSKTLRIEALLAARQFDEAEEELAKAELDESSKTKLELALVQAKIGQIQMAIAQRQLEESSDELPGVVKEAVEPEGEDELVTAETAELRGYRNSLAELVAKLLEIEPNSVGEVSLVAVCNNCIAAGKIEWAKDLVDQFLGYFPDSTTALFYKQILLEPEPDKVSKQRRKEIEKEILLNIADPIRRAMNLGVFYQRYNEPENASGEFKKVLKIETLQEGVVEGPAFEQSLGLLTESEEITVLQRLAASYLFDIALGTKDWQLAEQIAQIGRRENIDGCAGKFFAARLAGAKEQYKDALAMLEECLRQRPVFSHAFSLRSNVNAALGNEHASIEDVRKAASLNPLDGSIAKGLAFTLYRRNQKLGPNISTDQVIETRDALVRAMRLNPREWRLQSFYAEYISEENPAGALAIRQRLQKAFPSVGNALLLGKMAMRIALRESNAERKALLFDIAASAFEQASAIEPRNKAVLETRAEYYRLTGQGEKAEQLLAQSQDRKLLWSHYFRAGQFDDAKRLLGQLYKDEPKDSDVVRGLLIIAEREADKEAVKKYSEELLSLEDGQEAHLVQIQAFLKVGLVKEAEYKLQSFKEKYGQERRALLLEAWLAMKQGQLKRALELANQSLETDQDNAVAWWLRGEINRLMANYDQAIIDLKTSKSLLDEPVARIALARAYLRVGRNEDAITELKNTIDAPQAPMAARALLEQIYLQLDRKGALRRFYDETLDKLPDSVLWHNRAGAFAVAQGDFGRAEQLYGQAWQKGRKQGRAEVVSLDGYLQALILSGKLEKVFEEGRKYVDSDFAPIAYLRMAEARDKLGDKASAIQYCRKAVDKAWADEIFASGILRRMYSLLGAEEVLSYCKERLEANPDSFAANFTMFNLAEINGEYNKAVGYIDKCLEIVGPDSPRRVNYIVRKALVLQLAYNKTSDNNYLKRAIVEYESLLAKMPNNTSVLNNLSYMLAENNERLAEALRYAKHAHEIRPNNPNLLDTYAYVLYKNGRFSEAAEFLQAALQQYEQGEISAPADVYEHLGQIREELGAADEALAAYKQALRIGADKLSEPVIERIKKAIERLSRQRRE